MAAPFGNRRAIFSKRDSAYLQGDGARRCHQR